MKKIIIILLLSLSLFGCSQNKDAKKEDYQVLMEQNEYIIVDVRTKEEFDEGHIKEAINIPYDEIDENIDLDKSKLIFVYCKSGGRSSVAYNTLIALGYNVFDLGAFDLIKLEKE